MDRMKAIREQARGSLHEQMAAPAFYYAGGIADEDPVEITARRWTEFGPQGDVKGTSYAYAEREAEKPRLIFWTAKVRPTRGSVVVFSSTEAYKIDVVQPPNRETTTAFVTRLRQDDVDLYDYPARYG